MLFEAKPFTKKCNLDYFPIFITILSILSFIRILFFRGVAWDDNCWLLSMYESRNLEEFLRHGFLQLRRIPQGIFLYYIFGFYKTFDYAYLILHSITMIIKILSPIFLYLFVKNLSKGNRLLAFLVGSSFVICLMDNSLHIYSNLYYRLGVMFSIISFYWTERAIFKDFQWKYLLIALVFSGISYYVLMEGTIAFEPARLFLIWHVLSNKNFKRDVLVKKIIMTWIPFFLICIPFIFYKLIYKAYGIYMNAYAVSLRNLLDFRAYKQIGKFLLFQTWYIFIRYPIPKTIWSMALGIFAGILNLYFLRQFILNIDKDEWKEKRDFILYLILLGIFFLVPPLLMYLCVGHVPALGSESRHGIVLQIGYAIIMGNLLYILYLIFSSSILRLKLFNFLLAFILGLGVFFNNVGLDLCFRGEEKQMQFWKRFTERFPSLPEKAVFLMDVRDDFLPTQLMHLNYFYTDLRTPYDFELPLNLLYATAKEYKEFRRYKVYCVREYLGIYEEWFKNQDYIKFERLSHWGKDIFDLREIIVVHYRKGELLVNREILKKYPEVTYRIWLDKDFPKLPKLELYPLRCKFKG